MPVQVQLPGFNHAAPAVGLAQVIGTGFGAYRDYNQAQEAQAKTAQEQAQTQGLNIANEQSQRASDADKLRLQQLATPGSPATENTRAGALVQLGSLANTNFYGNPNDVNSPLHSAILNVSDPKQTGLGILQVLDATKGMALPLAEGQQKIDANKPIAEARKKMATVQEGKLEETKNQNSIEVGSAYEGHPIIKTSMVSKNSLKRALSILNNPNKPVTSKDLNLSYNDYINGVANGGVATEGKLGREMPETWVQDFNELKQKAGKNDDLRKTPAGARLINLLKENVYTVTDDIDHQIDSAAQKLNTNYQQSSNQKVLATSKAKLSEYTLKPAPNGHTVIIQNGHEFTWDAIAGKYY